MKKILIAVLLIATMTMGSAFSNEATVNIIAHSGETTQNSGIRVLEGDTALTTSTFDATFFTVATDAITLNEGNDSAIENTTGKFSVLVRRPTGNTVGIKVTASPLTNIENSNSVLNYTLSATDTLVLGSTTTDIADTTIGTDETIFDYTITKVSNGIIRNQMIFTYNIPIDATVEAGQYKSTVIFTITT